MENSHFNRKIRFILWKYIVCSGGYSQSVSLGLPADLCAFGYRPVFTLYLGAPQITKLGAGFKSVFGGLFAKGDKDDKSLSQFQALAVAISAQIGTGNVAGVATAITAGGPGAIFWMWLSAVLGMSTIFAEALLAQKYRVVSHGKYIGGPAFYITHGLTPKSAGARRVSCRAFSPSR
ncbi:amino-acid transporter sodium/alanine symporter [Neisseria gonorrhoeae]|uniref:Amino-acid transporter sodium/alanine symporter n=1 Tax=Neisseria gonorrhoeae TaxID=485 RepID=A0A379B1R9_NEIGO|nr:amino-acid transporter sodium/alanine symporter [Neisseria gonorrhoeae]